MRRRYLVAAVGASAAAFTVAGLAYLHRSAVLDGDISDASGRPISGAVVTLGSAARRQAQVTDPHGRYHFSSVPTGLTDVHVFAAGMIYDPGHQAVTAVRGENRHDVRLTAQAPGVGPGVTAPPRAVRTVAGGQASVELSIGFSPGPTSPLGTELLAVHPATGEAILLASGPDGRVVARVGDSDAAGQWLFVGTDGACQETDIFPTVEVSLS